MLLALTDRLRCTEPHADSWLVARADVQEGGRMVDGLLGCPLCRTERVVRGGVVQWSLSTQPPALSSAKDPHPDRVMRIGALMGFADSDVPYLVCGTDANVADGLIGLAETPLVLLNPPDDHAAPFATIIRGALAVPFAPGSVRGVMVDSAHADAMFLASCVRALMDGGRLVAPADVPVPAGVRELARDAEQWMAARTAASVTVPLRRAGG